MATDLMAASRQWASRPDDQRFLSLADLKAAVSRRRELSHERDLRMDTLQVEYDDDEVYLAGHNGKRVGFTHWSFGQLATIAKAPPSYLRTLPPALARANLTYGLNVSDMGKQEAKLLYSMPDEGQQVGQSRAFTSVRYGRIWDEEVVSAVERINEDGRWRVPTPFKKADGTPGESGFVVDKHSTTLYASDRDVFIFLVDEDRPIEVDGQTFFRGFYTWNSEVGKATFGLATFLYSYVCCNRIIWGARDVEELRIRHTAFAPDRFVEQAQPALAAMSEASTKPIEDAIHAAKAKKLGDTVADVEKWLVGKGFGKVESAISVNLASRGGDTGSSGDPTNLWDVVQGLTAYARQIGRADERVDFERQAGALLS